METLQKREVVYIHKNVDKSLSENIPIPINNPEVIVIDNVEDKSDLNTDKPKTPKYCRSKRNHYSLPCSECDSLCSYTLRILLNPKSFLSTDEIVTELKAHNHPTSRMIELENGQKRPRTTRDALQELIDHYVYSHNFVRP